MDIHTFLGLDYRVVSLLSRGGGMVFSRLFVTSWVLRGPPKLGLPAVVSHRKYYIFFLGGGLILSYRHTSCYYYIKIKLTGQLF